MHEEHAAASVPVLEPDEIPRVALLQSDDRTAETRRRILDDEVGVGGHLGALRRTAVGDFDLSTARTLEQLEESFELVPIAEAARRTFPSVTLDEVTEASVRVGRALDLELVEQSALFTSAGEFLALYRPADGGARPVAVFV